MSYSHISVMRDRMTIDFSSTKTFDEIDQWGKLVRCLFDGDLKSVSFSYDTLCTSYKLY